VAVGAVLFDFYGTLARAVEWGPTYGEVLAARGYELPEEMRRRWVSDAFDGIEHDEHSRSREHYVAWERRRLQDMVEACGVGDDDVDRLVDDLHGASKGFTMGAYEEVPGVLVALRRRGVRAVVCSNWDWDLDRALEQSGLTDLVDGQVSSGRAGARKPHPRIFARALAVAGVAPADALFVGDSWRADVEGALGAGLRAVHVRRQDAGPPGAQAEAPPLPDGATRVADLRGVLDLA